MRTRGASILIPLGFLGLAAATLAEEKGSKARVAKMDFGKTPEGTPVDLFAPL